MKNVFKDIKNWSSSMKLGTAIALGGVVIVGASLIYASSVDMGEPSISISANTPSVNPPSVVIPSVVDEKVEEIIRPYTDNCSIAHYFYDELDDAKTREKAIVSVPGASRTYMLSEGCDYSNNNNAFDVVASVSGKISDKLSDPTFGEIVILTHESGTKFIYASLSEVKVNKGQDIKQGDTLAKSGTSLYTTDLGSSLHFEIVKDGKHLNPEKMYSTSVEKL